MGDRLVVVYVCVAIGIYLGVILLSTIYYLVKNAHNQPSHQEKDGMLVVGVYDGSIRMRRYREFAFVHRNGEYTLSQESRKAFIEGIVFGNVWALLFLLISAGILFVKEDARIALPGVFVAIACLITLSIETELYQYSKCKNYLKKIRETERTQMMEYTIQGRRLVWEYDAAIQDASKLKDNNLYIEGVWNMKDTVGYTDTCVGLSVVSKDCFYFVTFGGVGFTMKVADGKVECIKKQITK